MLLLPLLSEGRYLYVCVSHVFRTPKGVLVSLTFLNIHSGSTHVYLDPSKNCQFGVSTSGLVAKGAVRRLM